MKFQRSTTYRPGWDGGFHAHTHSLYLGFVSRISWPHTHAVHHLFMDTATHTSQYSRRGPQADHWGYKSQRLIYKASVLSCEGFAIWNHIFIPSDPRSLLQASVKIISSELFQNFISPGPLLFPALDKQEVVQGRG